MSTWTSEPVLRGSAALCAFLALASCDGLPSLPGFGAPDPVRSITLPDTAVVVAAPRGYCIESGTSRPARGFVVMAGCALVSSEQRMPESDGLITVQIGGAGTATIDGEEQDLQLLLATAQGAAVLSPSGDPTSIEIDQIESRNGAVYVHFVDSGAPPADGLEQREWRAFFDIGDRLATVTLRGFERAQISQQAGLDLVRQTVSRIQSATASANSAQ